MIYCTNIKLEDTFVSISISASWPISRNSREQSPPRPQAQQAMITRQTHLSTQTSWLAACLGVRCR